MVKTTIQNRRMARKASPNIFRKTTGIFKCHYAEKSWAFNIYTLYNRKNKGGLNMDKDIAKVAIVTTGKIVVALMWGEMLGGVVSKPIAAWRTKQNVNVDNISTLIDVQNQRICDLEEKVLGKSK
jgi:hypothetical protein